MICSAILVAALLAAASEETINVAAWIEVDSLVVGQEYELILELDLVEVKTPGAVRKLLAKARKERKRAVLVLMQRGQDRNFVSLRITN